MDQREKIRQSPRVKSCKISYTCHEKNGKDRRSLIFVSARQVEKAGLGVLHDAVIPGTQRNTCMILCTLINVHLF